MDADARRASEWYATHGPSAEHLRRTQVARATSRIATVRRPFICAAHTASERFARRAAPPRRDEDRRRLVGAATCVRRLPGVPVRDRSPPWRPCRPQRTRGLAFARRSTCRTRSSAVGGGTRWALLVGRNDTRPSACPQRRRVPGPRPPVSRSQLRSARGRRLTRPDRPAVAYDAPPSSTYSTVYSTGSGCGEAASLRYPIAPYARSLFSSIRTSTGTAPSR